MNKKHILLLFGILGTHLFLLIFLKFTAWPEMTLWPYLMTKGWLPYSNIAIAHTPLMLIDLSIFYKIFGVGILQLKIFTWLLILFFDGLIFTVVKRLWNIKTAFISLIFYIPWMLFYDGNGLWFDLYMGLLAFTSFYFAKQKKWFWTGIFWAFAFISKQTAIWFLIPIIFELVQNILRRPCKDQPFKVFLWFTLGALCVLVPFILLLNTFHLLPSFWNWAVKFGIFILPKAQGQIQLPTLKNLMASIFPFLIFTPLILKTGKKYLNLLIWIFAGSLGAYPRFEFFHFQPAIPFLAIASAIVFMGIRKNKTLLRFVVLIYIICSIYLFTGFFIRNYNEGTRFYGQDVADIVTYVKYNTEKGDKIFVLNWWDNIYALTDTIPSTDPWVPQLSWYSEVTGVQEKMIEDLKSNPPKLIIFSPYTEMGLSAYIPQKVYNYITENYKLSQSVDNLEILIPKY